ncbi:MAG: DUF309 domain-containing protein [Deltaproteobacteria bacterium]|nr:DUF309 domain-containing protein [Deltaproteobacteria bacterium]
MTFQKPTTEPDCPLGGPTRYSKINLPPYRFIPGINAHPVRDPDGHMHGHEETHESILPAKQWQESSAFLYGVDLYNRAFWWESHEQWEGLWLQTDKTGTQAQFLQGLIQISASFIKWYLGQKEGMSRLYEIGFSRLKTVEAQHSVYMGLNLQTHLNKLEQHFTAALQHSGIPVESPLINYPFLELAINL